MTCLNLQARRQCATWSASLVLCGRHKRTSNRRTTAACLQGRRHYVSNQSLCIYLLFSQNFPLMTCLNLQARRQCATWSASLVLCGRHKRTSNRRTTAACLQGRRHYVSNQFLCIYLLFSQNFPLMTCLNLQARRQCATWSASLVLCGRHKRTSNRRTTAACLQGRRHYVSNQFLCIYLLFSQNFPLMTCLNLQARRQCATWSASLVLCGRHKRTSNRRICSRHLHRLTH